MICIDIVASRLLHSCTSQVLDYREVSAGSNGMMWRMWRKVHYRIGFYVTTSVKARLLVMSSVTPSKGHQWTHRDILHVLFVSTTVLAFVLVQLEVPDPYLVSCAPIRTSLFQYIPYSHKLH